MTRAHQQPLHDEHRRGAGHEPGQQADAPEPAEGGAVDERPDQADRAEPDEQVREGAGPEAAHDQGVDADLAEPAPGLEAREQRRRPGR